MAEDAPVVAAFKHVPPQFERVADFICRFNTVMPCMTWWTETFTKMAKAANKQVEGKKFYLQLSNKMTIRFYKIFDPQGLNPLYIHVSQELNNEVREIDFFVLDTSFNRNANRVICADQDWRILYRIINSISGYYTLYNKIDIAENDSHYAEVRTKAYENLSWRQPWTVALDHLSPPRGALQDEILPGINSYIPQAIVANNGRRQVKDYIYVPYFVAPIEPIEIPPEEYDEIPELLSVNQTQQ